MSARDVMLTDERWKKIEPLISKAWPRRKGGRLWSEDRMVFGGILWVLKTGAK